MITVETANRLNSSAATTATSGTNHSIARSGSRSPSRTRTIRPASPTWATKRHEFHATLMRSDFRIHNRVVPPPSTYAARTNTGLLYSSPNISGMDASESECDSLRISTCSAVASDTPNAMTIAKNGSDHARSGTVVQPGVTNRSSAPTAARTAA